MSFTCCTHHCRIATGPIDQGGAGRQTAAAETSLRRFGGFGLLPVVAARERPMCVARRAYGLTLIELLVLIAIIAILADILFPVFPAARELARQAACISILKELFHAFLMYTQ